MFDYITSSNYSSIYPIELFFGLLRYNGGHSALPKDYRGHREWGKPLSTFITGQRERPAPEKIDMVWLSLVESTFYSIEKELPTNNLKQWFEKKDEASGENVFERIIVGMAPYGGVAVWCYGIKKSVLASWMKAEKTQVDMKVFHPMYSTIVLEDYCKQYISGDARVKDNLEKNGLPAQDLFDCYMQQYTYRYNVQFGHWDDDEKEWKDYEEDETKPELDYIEETLYDGTHDKLRDGGLFNYHEAGKPKKLTVKWRIKKSEYYTYFWFENEAIRAVFDKFYGIHPDTKSDFIIHIDPEKKKYQLVLYRYGLQEPKIIPKEAYQLIVFKNKFEHFRSENYDQPRGAWIW